MLVLGRVDGEPSRTPECYRSGVRGRFICLGRWPDDTSFWCVGCGRIARIGAAFRSPDSGVGSGRIGLNNSGPGAASTAPDLADAHRGGDDG